MVLILFARYCQDEVYNLMEQDPFQRFKASSGFEELLGAVGAYTRDAIDPMVAIELEDTASSIDPMEDSSSVAED